MCGINVLDMHTYMHSSSLSPSEPLRAHKRKDRVVFESIIHERWAPRGSELCMPHQFLLVVHSSRLKPASRDGVLVHLT